MTVINSMIMNPELGAIVTDEQASIGNRKVDASRKISTIFDKNSVVIGGESGYTNLNYRSVILAKNHLNKDIDYEVVLNTFGKALQKIYTDTILRTIEGQYGFSLNNALTGILDNGKKLKSEYADKFVNEFQRLRQDYQGAFILLGKAPNRDMDLIYVNSKDGLADFQSHPYATTGTGSDISHGELIKYFSNIKRDKRNNISLDEGLSTLLFATYLSGKNNAGVGGIPEIAILDDNKIIMPNEMHCQLASEIAISCKKKLIRNEFMKEALNELVYDDNSFNQVNIDLRSEAKSLGNENSLDLFLRGYRI